MTVRPIVISGEPVLHQPAVPVIAFDGVLHELIQDMYQTMDAAPGVGLAAPQIGVNQQIFVYDYPTDEGQARRGVAINPKLFISPIDIREPTVDEDEGCLSFPGERFGLVRAETAILRAQDEKGDYFELEAHGWFARILQHEFDHLLGYLYLDRLSFPLAKQAEKVARKNGWGKPGFSWLPGVDHLEG